MASVKVAVRVRPFSQRELDMNSTCIIRMHDNSTSVVNLKANDRDEQAKHKEFTFDHSYWSHDDTGNFTSQEQVFEDLGSEVVDCAFQGFNACIFAYGQTGSGKTYTMMGAPDDPGLTPRICRALFDRMKANSKNYRVSVSYLEIYQERVTDLLSTEQHSHSLRIREQNNVPYVEKLTVKSVTNYQQIEQCMEKGNTRRTTAKTKMNDTSSRSHAIFTINFIQASLYGDDPIETMSKIHLVDLAGSERANSTGATGKQLKEGACINKSLVTLGQVISKLSKLSTQRHDNRVKVHIPYRDSNLTWILKDSLGGNSKTIMLAAISPADCNFAESLSTLRYADSAKSIINKPRINEDPRVREIRELREEIKRLKAQQPMRRTEIFEKEQEEQKLTHEWTMKWKEAHAILQEQQDLALRKSGHGVCLDSVMPHLTVLVDPYPTTGVTLYPLKEGETSIATDDEEINKDIALKGVESFRCSIKYEDGISTIYPKGDSQIKINNILIESPTKLTQGCYILLAGTYLFKYNDPAEAAELRKNEGKLNLSRMSLLSSTSDLSSYMDSSQTFNDTSKTEIEIEKLNLAKDKEDFEKRLMSFQESQALFHNEKLKMEQDAKVQELRLESDRQMIEYMKKAQEERLESERLKLEEEEKKLEQRKMELQLQKEKELEMLGKGFEGKSSNAWLEKLQSIKAALELNEDNKEKMDELLQKVATLSTPKEDDLKHFNDVLRQLTSKENPSESVYHLEILSLIENKLAELRGEKSINCDGVKRLLSNRSQKELDEIEQKKQSLHLPLCLSNGTVEAGTLSSDTYHTATSGCSTNLPSSGFVENLMSDSGVGLGGQFSRNNRNTDSSSDEDSKGVSDSQSTSSIENRPYVPKRRRKDLEILRTLSQKINQQKVLIMRGLDLGWSRQVLDEHISALNELQKKHVSLKYGSPLILSPTTEHPLQDLNSPSPSPIRPLHRGSTSTLDSTNFLINNQRYSSLSNFQLHRSMPSIAMSTDCDSIVSISGYFLRGAGKRTHYEYEVRITTTFGEWWSILRRYSRFRDLHLAMKAKYGEKVSQIPFPPRQLFANSESLAQSRKRQLETYLRRLIEVCKTHPSCCLAYSETISKADLINFSPFFSKGVFENSKFGTS